MPGKQNNDTFCQETGTIDCTIEGGGGGEVQEIVTWGLPSLGYSDHYNTHFCQLTTNLPGNFARRNLTPEHIYLV